MADFPFHDVAA